MDLLLTKVKILKTNHSKMNNKTFLKPEEIKALNSLVMDNLPLFLDHFGVSYRESDNYYMMPCPVHGGGANACSCVVTKHGEWRGAWACKARGCEKVFQRTTIGLIRGILSFPDWLEDEKLYHFGETLDFCKKMLQVSDLDIAERKKILPDLEKKYAKQQVVQSNVGKYSRRQMRAKLQIPSTYFLKRGFSKEVLSEFDVGECMIRKDPMFSRAVAPVYNENTEYVGEVGRMTRENSSYSKWRNSTGFRKSLYLYGLWVASEHIFKSKNIVLVEGQGDVWKLHMAGIKNAVGMFGSSLSEAQLRLIQTTTARNVIILTDNDEAGKKAKREITEKCSNLFNVYAPNFSGSDIGDMSVSKIVEEIKPQIEAMTNG